MIIYALKIKTGYTKKIINWFKKIYKKNIWTNYFNNALSNCSIPARLLYFVYDNKKLPTLKDLYGTKIIHHKDSKNKKTRKKRGGKRRNTRKKRGGDGIKGGKCAVCLEENSATHQFCERTEITVIEEDEDGNKTERTTHTGGHFFCAKCIAKILREK